MAVNQLGLQQHNWLTEAVAMPMAFHLLPVAAYTGAATITPCEKICGHEFAARTGNTLDQK